MDLYDGGEDINHSSIFLLNALNGGDDNLNLGTVAELSFCTYVSTPLKFFNELPRLLLVLRWVFTHCWGKKG